MNWLAWLVVAGCGLMVAVPLAVQWWARNRRT